MKYTDTQALRIVLDRVSLCEKHWQPYFDNFQEIYEVYRFYSPTTPSVERGEKSNIFIPYAFAQIETKLPRLIQALLSYDPFFKVYGIGEEDSARAEFVQNLLAYQIRNEIDTFWALLIWLKESSMYGNSFMYTPWVKEVRNLKRKIPQYIGQEIIGYDYARRNVVKKDQPDLQPIDIYDCLPAPYGSQIEAMPYFLVRSEPTASYLKEMAEKRIDGKPIFNPKIVKRLLEKSGGVGYIDKTREERMNIAGLSKIHCDDPYEPRYEMYTHWERDWVIRVVGNEVVQNDETPFDEEEIPILMAIDTPIPHELYGFGQIAPILKLNYYANDIINLNLDNFFHIVNPGLLVKRSANLNIPNFENNPSGIHPVDGDNSLQAIPRGSAQMDTMNNLGVLERLMNMTTGGGDIIRGLQASKGEQTAREVMSLIEQANYRFDLSIRLFKEFSLRKMLKMLLWRDQQYLPFEKAVRIHTEGGVQYPIYTPDDIMGNFDFYIRFSPVQGNKIAWAQSLIQFLDVLNADQGQHPEIVSQIAQALQLDLDEDALKNPALEAAQVIVQATQEGLLKNAQQAFTILNHVLTLLAPPQSKNAQRLVQRMNMQEAQGFKPQASEQREVSRA